MTNEDKIDSLEYLTKRHYATYQLVECGLLEYFAMLRQGKNIEFLDDLCTMDDLMEYTYIIRDTHQTKVN